LREDFERKVLDDAKRFECSFEERFNRRNVLSFSGKGKLVKSFKLLRKTIF
jgi:hypothetical protein